MDRMQIIEENFKNVKEKINEAVKRRGENKKVTLLGATKTVSPEDILYAEKLGLDVIGENKVQELCSKYDEIKNGPADIQFIGTLQKNKVKYIIDKVSLIHSCGNIKLAEEIGKRAEIINKTMYVLAEVNIGEEESKSGVMPDQVSDFLDQLNEIKGIKPIGLMTMAPAWCDESEYRNYFQKTYSIFVDNSSKIHDNSKESILSMGMTDSYEIAIEEGATMVRVGTGIFGGRNYSA